jgi:predicted nucleic acid-binding protein
MKHLFVDSGFYIAWLNPDDELHPLAVPWMQRQDLRVVTSEFVLLEVAARLSQPPLRSHFSLLLQRVRLDRNTRLVRSSQGLFNDAAELYAQRPDKGWSLVDCSSFILMQRFKLKDALTPDHHYEQAGFTPLLR